jgi:hypothetical protein
MAVPVRSNNPEAWELRRPARRRGGSGGDPLPAPFIAPAARVDDVIEAVPRAPSPAAAPPPLDLSVDTAPDESALLAIRHPSGALTLHPPVGDEAARRGAARRPAPSLRFRVELRRPTPPLAGRRGMASAVLKVVVLKVAGRVADAALPVLVRNFEEGLWRTRGLAEGFVRLDAGAMLRGAPLARAVPEPGPDSARSLLLLHGTFSHCAGAYKHLASGDFFARARGLYGDRVFAYEHFTLSRTPEENARLLLGALPGPPRAVDVVTHSRGGLVLRNLVERPERFGTAAGRLRLGHAVLAAAPNDGTPLASPARWRETVGFIANLLELFPDNPLTLAPAWVAEGIVWLAQRAAGGIPGLSAMDSGGALVADLQRPPGPRADAYSALVANYRAAGPVWERMVDAGLDVFFATANDLVVPTEAGWRIDRDGLAHVPADRVGCFGPGGNLRPGASDVHHLNLFQQPEAVDFLINALARRAQGLPAIALDRPLPDRRFARVARATAPVAPTLSDAAAQPPRDAPEASALAAGSRTASVKDRPDTLFLTVLAAPRTEPRPARERARVGQLFAQYRGARVIEPFHMGGEANQSGRHWRAIIAMHERIRSYIDGRGVATLPGDAELVAYGARLFDMLFQGDVKRLYDTARSLQGASRLDVIFTSMIPWVSDKPWEFAYDPVRRAFLATEEIHFVRNVLTAIPAEPMAPRRPPLRILVVVAQPVGTAPLSTEEEVRVIRRGFEALQEAGAVEVEVLPRATPARLHGCVATGGFDVVHFIGHGEFDPETQTGSLLFEDGQSAPQPLDDRTLREIFCQRGIRLLFLNACETGRGGRSDFNRGVAPALVAGGLPAVVANQYKVLDASATAFAQHFYWALAQGLTLGQAARESRIAVNYSISGEAIDWAVPVLYARDPSARLCEPGVLVATPTAPAVTRRSRRATARHAHRIGVWDVNRAFPGLEETLSRMNLAQDRFGFELVDVSAPLGTWRVMAKGGTRRPYLDAARVAEKLAHKPKELGVEFLACITDLPMMGTRGRRLELNLYGWWPVPRREPIMLFSTADLGLAAHGPDTDNAVTNVAVCGLLGLLVGAETHVRGPRTCPLFHDPRRSRGGVVRGARFDASCRRLVLRDLTRQLGPDEAARDLHALEALLSAFRPASARQAG